MIMKRHFRIHTGAKPYSCRHCTERFARLVHFHENEDMTMPTCTWFTWHICQKKFTWVIHTYFDKKLKPYVCGKCQKCFWIEISWASSLRL